MGVTVDVEFAERYWYPDDGGEVWLSGYQLVDPESGSYLARNAPLLVERGLHVAGLAGARHRTEALETDALAPGSPLELRRDPDNEFDANAIAVHAGGAQVGFVPAELAAELAGELDAGRPWSAVVLRDQRPSPRDPRTGVTMLLAPGAAIELRVRAGQRWPHAAPLWVVHTAGSGLTTWDLVVPELLGGAGMGMVLAPLFDIILAGVDDDEVGSASGTLNAVQQLGGALGARGIGRLAKNRGEYPVAAVPTL